MTPLDYALHYAGRGWRVFPVHTVREIDGRLWCSCSDAECEHQAKHPVAKLAPQGVKNATVDPDQIRQWWHVFPDANIGIATGRESNLVVIDVDIDPAKGKAGDDTLAALTDEYGPLPDTVTVITGGGGLHYLFSYPAGVERIKSTSGVIGKDVDSRGDGGYIVGVPGRHISGNCYRHEGSSDPTEGVDPAPLPRWLVDKLSAASVAPVAPAPGAAQLGAVEVRELRAALAYIDPDGRDDWLRVGMALQATGAGAQAFGIWCEWSQGSEKYNAADQRRTWASFKSGGVTKSTIFAAAQAAGWINSAAKRAAGSDVVVPFAAEERKARAEKTNWREQLGRTARGKLYSDLYNVVLILRHDPAWDGVVAFNEFSFQIIKLKHPPYQSKLGEWGDIDDSKTVLWLTRYYGIRPPSRLVAEAVKVVSDYAAFHPVRSYLTALAWDGTPRTKQWAIRYLGAADTPYHRLVAQCWLISAVARIMEPGCKADNVVILEGEQGMGKSSALAILAGDWFSDTAFDLGGKETFMMMRGKWIIELGELDSFNRAESSRAKAFFAAAADTYRPPWGRHAIDVRRQCVFAGTVNQDEYFRDETGNRRYWPLRCEGIDLAALARDRDQLWAEALALYHQHESWWIDAELDYVKAEQEARYAQDAWEGQIKGWLRQHEKQALPSRPFMVTIQEALVDCLQIPIAKWTRSDQMRVSGVFKRCGLIRKRFYGIEGYPWAYTWRFHDKRPW